MTPALSRLILPIFTLTKMKKPPISRRLANLANLSRGLFQPSLLQFLLALNAVPRPRHRFQALGIDVLAAGDALAEGAFANARQSPVYHLQELPVVVALMEEEFLGIGARGTIGDVLRRVLIRRAPVLLCTGDHAAQLLLPRLQSFLELIQSLLFHG